MCDFLNIIEVQNPLKYKTLLLYFSILAYSVKRNLNQKDVTVLIESHMKRKIPEFVRIAA